MFGGMMGDDEADLKKARNMALIAGVIFGIGWWVYIDGAAWGSAQNDPVADKAAGYHWLPGLGVTIAFVMINGMRWQELSDENPSVATRARCFLISALVIALACISVSLFIMVEVFINDDTLATWTGISVFIQCLLIFVAAFVMRAGNMPASDGF
mmetsp:Transcript_148369/g.360166  ORF Transcript_148369/g.360166 Transcript_148369/m.360166 type:complete len:155 (-) Transcript_148369:144-608(-)